MNVAVTDFRRVSEKRTTKRRKLRDIIQENPHVDPFPEGWFVVDFSKNVKVDKLTSKKWVGEDIVYFRHPVTREVVVTQAYCPHFGGHFDAYKKGGCVENGVITCPYHHMSFDPLRYLDQSKKTPDRYRLKVYKTFEAHGFVMALRQRDETAPELPKPDVSFPGVDETDFVFGTESFGIFHGDSMVPLLANADYEHFRTVHAFPYVIPEKGFEIDADGLSCAWSFHMRDRTPQEGKGLKPHMGGKMLWSRQKRWLGHVAKEGTTPEKLVHVNAYGVGASLSKSEWYQPSWGLHLLSLLYVTPIDPYSYEIFANCGVSTIRRLPSKTLQRIVNTLGSKFHLWANIYFAKYDDLPYYNTGKIRLNNPAYNNHDSALRQYVSWYKSTFYSDEYQKITDGIDLEFT